MNKKIKIIDLFQKYANGEQMPKTIKSANSVFVYDDKDKKYYGKDSEKCIYLSLDNFKDLENEVEILEDNTEEIERIEAFCDLVGMTANEEVLYKMIRCVANKTDELVKAINQMRKGKENE